MVPVAGKLDEYVDKMVPGFRDLSKRPKSRHDKVITDNNGNQATPIENGIPADTEYSKLLAEIEQLKKQNEQQTEVIGQLREELRRQKEV